MYRVRFNLGRGENYKKWVVTNSETRERTYYDPETTTLFMMNGKFKNRRKSANRIKEGSNKFVCAWIECDDVWEEQMDSAEELDTTFEYRYNPRVHPYWVGPDGENADNHSERMLYTINNKIFA